MKMQSSFVRSGPVSTSDAEFKHPGYTALVYTQCNTVLKQTVVMHMYCQLQCLMISFADDTVSLCRTPLYPIRIRTSKPSSSVRIDWTSLSVFARSSCKVHAWLVNYKHWQAEEIFHTVHFYPCTPSEQLRRRLVSNIVHWPCLLWFCSMCRY